MEQERVINQDFDIPHYIFDEIVELKRQNLRN